MMKQAILISSLTLLPLTLANAHWYGGFNLGVNSVTVDKELNYPLIATTPSFSDFHSSYNNFHAQLLGGRKFAVRDRLHVDVETNFDFYTGRATQNIRNWFLTAAAGAKEQLDYGFGLFALADYQYNDSFNIYIGPGILTNRFSVSSLNATGGNLGVTGSFHDNLTGWGIKTGIANHLNAHTDLIMGYQFNQYQSVSWTATEPLSGDALTARYKPYANLFMIGLQYNV